MKISLLILCFFASIFSAFAQNPNLDFKYALKGYNQTTYFNDSHRFGDSYISRHRLDLFQPIAGLQWQNKRHNAHEIALNYLGSHNYNHKIYSNPDPNGNVQLVDGFSGRYFDLVLSYEYQLLFNKKKDTKLVPSLGFGLNPYFSRHKFRTHDAEQQRNITTIIGGKVMVTPRLMYFISPKVFFDFNTPFCLIDIQSESYQQSSVQRPGPWTRGNVGGEELPRVYQLRIGLGLKL